MLSLCKKLPTRSLPLIAAPQVIAPQVIMTPQNHNSRQRQQIASLRTHALKLDPQETQLCNVLLEVTEYLRRKRPELAPVTLRIAGGWVLGIQSHDMDVAIDTMMGFDFAQHVHDYIFEVRKEPQLLGHGGKIAKIASNPEKSKHLETATIQLCGLEVDFVNLRNEAYTEGSRIPTVTFGSPEEDAARRDLTINALFYNLHTREVEDFLDQGWDDLQNGIIRTPLDPYETFRDDPLRILRAIRFASRFGYEIHESITKAAHREDIQERVGEELRKMLGGPRPYMAIRTIHDFGIYKGLFLLPATKKDPALTSIQTADAVLHAKQLESLVHAPSRLEQVLPASHNQQKLPVDMQRHLFLASGLFPFRVLQYGKESYAIALARDGVKLSVAEGVTASCLLEAAADVESLLDDFHRNCSVAGDLEKQKVYRRRLGLFVRKTGRVLREWFPLSILFAAASPRAEGPMEERFPLYVALQKDIERLGLSECYDERPVLNGNEVMELMREWKLDGSNTKGRWVGDILERVLHWQLEEGGPGKEQQISREACIRFVKEQVDQGEIQLSVAPPKKPKHL